LLSAETRKDSAVHVSLSSSLLVKQPGAGGPNLSLERRSALIRREITTDNYRLLITHLEEELYRRGSLPGPLAPAPPRSVAGL
jgi:hypothetical protein